MSTTVAGPRCKACNIYFKSTSRQEHATGHGAMDLRWPKGKEGGVRTLASGHASMPMKSALATMCCQCNGKKLKMSSLGQNELNGHAKRARRGGATAAQRRADAVPAVARSDRTYRDARSGLYARLHLACTS
eukprot:3366190-Pleurochrysis_carterae.AAC.1